MKKFLQSHSNFQSVVSVMWFLVFIYVLVRRQDMLFGFLALTGNDDSLL